MPPVRPTATESVCERERGTMPYDRDPIPAPTPQLRAIDHALPWTAIQLRDTETALQELEAELTSLRDKKAQLLAEQVALQRQRARLQQGPAGSPTAQRPWFVGHGRAGSSTGPRGSA
jgi:hypothetical protein